jgi:Arc/MetJ family transcription regulator
MTFDTRTQTVYEVQVCDFANSRAYRMINPEYQLEFNVELANRGINDCAWDNVNWTDLEVDDDFIQKAMAIKAGETYDTRISVPLDFTDAELLKYMSMAHELDMKFNDFVEQALREAIEQHKRDPEGMKAKTEQWMKDHDIT